MASDKQSGNTRRVGGKASSTKPSGINSDDKNSQAASKTRKRRPPQMGENEPTLKGDGDMNPGNVRSA